MRNEHHKRTPSGLVTLLAAASVACVWATGCAQSEPPDVGGSGGRQGGPSGGRENTGGIGTTTGGSTPSTGGTSTGGTASTGGLVGSSGGFSAGGGSASSGGAQATGGSAQGGSGTGGRASGGGSTSSGGVSATGGSKSTGGVSASAGGTPATGGSPNYTGGTSPTGGAASTGGTSNTGGSPSYTGGTSPTGGATSTGGTSNTGGSPSTGANLLTSSGFETGLTDGWRGRGNAVLAVSAEQYHAGLHSLKVTGRTATWNGAEYDVTTLMSPGASYEVTAWARLAPGSASSDLILTRELQGCGTTSYVRLNSVASATDAAWAQLTGTLSVPSGCSPTKLLIYVESSNATVSYYVDDTWMQAQ